MGIKDKKGDKGKNISPTPDLFPKTTFNYPVFCFKYLHKDHSLSQCDKDEKVSLIEKLHKFSSMTWEQIRLAPRHGLGQEKITSFNVTLPGHVTEDVSFYALRFDGKKPIVGYKTDFIFHIVYIDRDFTVYKHGD
jgi:hypothetical protein